MSYLFFLILQVLNALNYHICFWNSQGFEFVFMKIEQPLQKNVETNSRILFLYLWHCLYISLHVKFCLKGESNQDTGEPNKKVNKLAKSVNNTIWFDWLTTFQNASLLNDHLLSFAFQNVSYWLQCIIWLALLNGF